MRWLPIITALVLGACNYVGAAKDTFRRQDSCPADRISARERDDIHASEGLRHKSPPREVATDPERMREWEAEQRDERDTEDSSYTVVEVDGCGVSRLYQCHSGKSEVWCLPLLIHD
jgi:hypothetical protein